MVLILSTPTDYNTNYVIEWLRFYKVKFLRLSSEDEIEFITLQLHQDTFDIDLIINNKIYKASEFKCFWYRRSQFSFKHKMMAGQTK